MIAASVLSSCRTDWRTPAVVLDLVRQLGPIGLDPAGHQESLVGAAVEYRLARGDDGLVMPWTVSGLVYVNPPFGRALPEWAAKAAAEARKGAEIILLTPARTDTRWWHGTILQADAICYWRGRLTFEGAPAPSPFPSALSYWGPSADRFAEVFGTRGHVALRAAGLDVSGLDWDERAALETLIGRLKARPLPTPEASAS